MNNNKGRSLYVTVSILAAFGGVVMLLTLLFANPAFAQPQPEAQSLSESQALCSLTVNTDGQGMVDVTKTNTDPELSVEIADDQSYVVLENSQIRVRYEAYVDQNDGTDQFSIRDFVMKQAGNIDQVGNNAYLDAGESRGALQSAQLVYDGTDKKTVRLTWKVKPGSALPNKTVVKEVSIVPNGPFLEMRNIDVAFGYYIVDFANPGGQSSGTYYAHGGNEWVRGYVTYPDYFYNRFPGDGVNDPVDGGSLNYNDHFIIGTYSTVNGIGFGRVIPVEQTRIIRLLFNRGMEAYPPDPNHAPYTSYLFGVTDGIEEIEQLGMQLADAADGDYGYLCGDEVELTAVPEEGWYFSSWSGDLSGSENPETLTLTGQHEVTATFASDLYSLNVTVVPGDGSGGIVSREPDKVSYQYGEVVTLTAQTQQGWTFQGWSGDLTGTETTQVVTMTEDVAATATFTQDAYDLSVTTVGNGTVERTPEKETYTYGEIVLLEAMPDPGWSFDGWSGGLTGNPTAVEILGNTSVTATFSEDSYTLTVDSVGDGMVEVSPLQSSYKYGDVVTLTAVPDAGRYFNGWSGSASGLTNPLDYTIVGDTSITATFGSSPSEPLKIYLPMVLRP